MSAHTTSDDPVDFSEFVLRRSSALKTAAFLLTGTQASAEDLLQDALLKVWRRWPRLAKEGNPEPYIRRVIYTTYISWSRRKSARAVDLFESNQDETATSDSRVDLVRALQRLPEQQRTVLILRYYEDLGEQQVADMLNVSVGTIKSQASRGLAAMRKSGLLQEASLDE